MGRTVLVVDDDASFRSLAARILTSWGHHVVGQAADVAEALELAAERRPDMVLADIGLPDGDGFELARRLRSQDPMPSVVLISSDAEAANGPAAIQAGALGFLPKDQLLGPAARALIADG